ncbi:MAG: L-seryl-tRNA(Sec) selenium transferase [Myxococcales bacterium]|nr:L-seryl-tRNA(Sec) selenium transferase [Myxococcales bacterium]
MAKVAPPGPAAALLRRIPKVDDLLGRAELAPAVGRLGRARVTALVRHELAAVRREAQVGREPPDPAALAERVVEAARALLASRVRRVINATGVVLHTNLGRAPLSGRAVAALAATSGAYGSVELDVATGRRGVRAAFAERALASLVGAEDALVVNNNAGAVLLVLAALAAGRPVLVSRGELVEIGGGFRVPEVLACSGARLREVGTTNRTRLGDYAEALAHEPDCALILRVHPGNFRQTGFVERPTLPELAALAARHGAWLVKDLGGGALFDPARHDLPGEPTVQSAVARGAHLVCFSTDKLLGGPQGGAIVGRAELVARARRHPLARALRLGRLALVALEATLDSYLSGDLAELPVFAALTAPLAAVRARVERWVAALAGQAVAARVVAVEGATGGGALAEMPLASFAAELRGDDVEALAARLRAGEPPVLGRIHEGALLLDGRSVLAADDDALVAAVVRASRPDAPG